MKYRPRRSSLFETLQCYSFWFKSIYLHSRRENCDIQYFLPSHSVRLLKKKRIDHFCINIVRIILLSSRYNLSHPFYASFTPSFHKLSTADLHFINRKIFKYEVQYYVQCVLFSFISMTFFSLINLKYEIIVVNLFRKN